MEPGPGTFDPWSRWHDIQLVPHKTGSDCNCWIYCNFVENGSILTLWFTTTVVGSIQSRSIATKSSPFHQPIQCWWIITKLAAKAALEPSTWHPATFVLQKKKKRCSSNSSPNQVDVLDKLRFNKSALTLQQRVRNWTRQRLFIISYWSHDRRSFFKWQSTTLPRLLPLLTSSSNAHKSASTSNLHRRRSTWQPFGYIFNWNGGENGANFQMISS